MIARAAAGDEEPVHRKQRVGFSVLEARARSKDLDRVERRSLSSRLRAPPRARRTAVFHPETTWDWSRVGRDWIAGTCWRKRIDVDIACVPRLNSYASHRPSGESVGLNNIALGSLKAVFGAAISIQGQCDDCLSGIFAPALRKKRVFPSGETESGKYAERTGFRQSFGRSAAIGALPEQSCADLRP